MRKLGRSSSHARSSACAFSCRVRDESYVVHVVWIVSTGKFVKEVDEPSCPSKDGIKQPCQ